MPISPAISQPSPKRALRVMASPAGPASCCGNPADCGGRGKTLWGGRALKRENVGYEQYYDKNRASVRRPRGQHRRISRVCRPAVAQRRVEGKVSLRSVGEGRDALDGAERMVSRRPPGPPEGISGKIPGRTRRQSLSASARCRASAPSRHSAPHRRPRHPPQPHPRPGRPPPQPAVAPSHLILPIFHPV